MTWWASLEVSTDTTIEEEIKMAEKKRGYYLCGFVFRSGKELDAWQVEISEEDEGKIMEILEKYETEGCSVVDASDELLRDCF
jgi:hypothetical protein